MRGTALLALAVALASAVDAHYFISDVNGSTGPLRPIVAVQYSDQNPVTGDQIETDDIICNTARPFGARAPNPLTVPAGGVIRAKYSNAVGHPGPCHVYIGEGLKPAGWSKIWENYWSATEGWCNDIIERQNSTLIFNIPAELAPGSYVLRIDHIGLHGAGSVGGAQFYPRCIDINVTGSGTAKPPYELAIPGAWNSQTPGVLYNIYCCDNPVARYPKWGGAVWTPTPGATTRTTTTTTISPRSSSTTTTTTVRSSSTTTTTVRSSPTTTTTVRPSSTTTTVRTTLGPTQTALPACSPKYGQCGGLGWTGANCCMAGSTCTFSNNWYSQCL